MIGSSGPEKETRAMNQEQKVIRVKVRVLELAKQLGNVSAACRVMGYALSRQIDTRLALAARRAAIETRQPPRGCIHHSDRGVQGEFKRSSQHLDRENCDDYSKAPFRSMRASTVAITGPASGSTAGELSAVLGIDCGRPFNRGRCYRRRSVARRGWPVVPEGGRHATVTFFAVFEAPVGPLSIVCRARRDRHLACSRTGSLRDCPQAWAGPFDDLPRAAPERRDA